MDNLKSLLHKPTSRDYDRKILENMKLKSKQIGGKKLQTQGKKLIAIGKKMVSKGKKLISK
jgi:hypothetical protein